MWVMQGEIAFLLTTNVAKSYNKAAKYILK